MHARKHRDSRDNSRLEVGEAMPEFERDLYTKRALCPHVLARNCIESLNYRMQLMAANFSPDLCHRLTKLNKRNAIVDILVSFYILYKFDKVFFYYEPKSEKET